MAKVSVRWQRMERRMVRLEDQMEDMYDHYQTFYYRERLRKGRSWHRLDRGYGVLCRKSNALLTRMYGKRR